jgi:hypothetical protein
VFNTRLNRIILATGTATLLVYGFAITPPYAATRMESAVAAISQKADCRPQSDSEFPAIRVAPAQTIPVRSPVGIPLDTIRNTRIG